MKEIPMLFSTPMVQAILAGRKTMTRRIVKMPKEDIKEAKWGYTAFTPKGHISFRGIHSNGQYGESFVKCPYGQPGDLLWVRETWAPDLAGDDASSHIEYIRYVADGTRLPIKWVKDYDRYSNRPGIHMNKEYARIWLQVANIRVERLQDIAEEDAKAEGVEVINDGPFPYRHYGSDTTSCAYARTSFQSLWQSINGDESWDANPFVWVVSFTVLSTTGKPLITEKINA
jgi:hypothetical protein